MKKKNIILGILAAIVITTGLTACKDNSDNERNPSDTNISGEIDQAEEKATYNNGSSFVSYKGKTYFREYNNASIEKVALYGEFDFEKEKKTSKYINVISKNGNIENLFKDEGYGDFYILEDRFFFAGYQDKLYSVNMQGEDYREIAKGSYVKCDEEKQEIYYTNSNNNNALYKINAKNLKITKISNQELKYPIIEGEKVYYFEFDEAKNTRVLALDMLQETTTELGTIEKIAEQNVEDYIASSVVVDNILFVSIGHDEGTLHTYTDSRLYCINLKSKEVKLLDTNVSKELRLKNDALYYQEYSASESVNSVKKVDLNTLKITEIENHNQKISIEDEIITDVDQNIVYLDGIYRTEKVIFSKAEIEEFEKKYVANDPNIETMVNVRNVEKVNNKVYFLLELSKRKEEADIGWRPAYERIASEKYCYDLNSGRKTLIYLYKVTDKDLNQSEDDNASGENGDFNAPLAENEMYLEIRLADKGLKETFDIRVEEVGGMIIGKRIEYEGTHSRSEEVLKIKVTKEIGAMLSVYIDDKLDSQMLIEE